MAKRRKQTTRAAPRAKRPPGLTSPKAPALIPLETGRPAEKEAIPAATLLEPLPEVVLEARNRRLYTIGGVAALAVMAAALTVLVTSAGQLYQREQHLTLTEQPEVAEVKDQQPSEQPEQPSVFNRSEWSVEVLNGTRVAGAARKVADQLAGLGYHILRVANANRRDYASTELQVSSELIDQAEFIKTDLQEILKLTQPASELKEGEVSARIIVGADQ